MNELEVHIEALRRDRSHGASQLAGRALMIMKYAAGNANCNTKAEFFEYMQKIAGELAEARPAMVAISNSVEQLMQILLPLARSEHDVAEVRSFTVQAAADLITSIQEAKSHAIQNGADLIHDGALVITCSYSSTVIASLSQATARGKTFKVLALESKVGDLSYGEVTASRLARYGIPVQVIPDRQVEKGFPGVGLVLLGADAVLNDGSVINGYPSLFLASAVVENSPPLPVYIICETTKFYPGRELVPVEAGFEIIPARLITAIVTEKGQHQPI